MAEEPAAVTSLAPEAAAAAREAFAAQDGDGLVRPGPPLAPPLPPLGAPRLACQGGAEELGAGR